jgi:RNA polymerase sigma-70 factor (ECF subfamily)
MDAGRRSVKMRRSDFEVLYQRHSREVWALVYARWLDADTALDIAQEAFLRLWKRWDEGEVIVNPRAWLLRVARNLSEDHGRSSFHKNGTHSPQVMNGIRADDPPPLYRLEREEAFAQLRAALAEIPPSDREILVHRYALDRNASEIAELLAIKTSAVQMRLTRARQRLAQRLTGQRCPREPRLYQRA